MAMKHTVTLTIAVDGRGLTTTREYTADSSKSFEIFIPDSTTDQLMNMAIKSAPLKNLFLMSDQDITIETNHSVAPTDTINLKANVPMIWNEDLYYANPFTGDVTKFYLTNSSGADAMLYVEILEDATP